MGLVIYSNAGGDGDLLLAKPSLPCKSISAKEKDKAVHLTWEDPDSPEDTELYSEWASTRIVRKEGGFPVDENDGITVVTSTTKNEYKDAAYVDSGLMNGTTYYYRAFTCSADEVVNASSNIQVSATPRSFRIMTVTIDLNDSNPATCGSYADDATDMPSGKTEEAITAWQEFFGYRPCLFKDGKVVGYLNPNDYTKFENGDPADITSGDAGDVMVEFPRRGIKISKSGKVITVSMTEDLNNPKFTYYAHTKGSDQKDYFYLGAYAGYSQPQDSVEIPRLRSLSGKTAERGCTLSEWRDQVRYNGSNYQQMTWYQCAYLQAMYVLEFCGNLDSKTAVGYGYTKTTTHKSGTLNTNGLVYGTTAKNAYIKLFGLEDLWGSNGIFLEGCYIDGLNQVCTATDNFEDVSKYTIHGSFIDLDPGIVDDWIGGWVKDVIGSSELPFFPIDFDGSNSTYFCAYGGCHSNSAYCRLCTNTSTTTSKNHGIFAIECTTGISEGYANARLSYY